MADFTEPQSEINSDLLQEVHYLLSLIESHLARQSIPSNWEAAGIAEIHTVQEIIENIKLPKS